ncbi:MAG: hypothetical protein ABIG37_01350 [Nanoarchaeota archaeon]|nr:hypothetical protein [Nanoarchaeota archaeon]
METNIKKILNDIKQLKIQGATNIAKAGLRAYIFKHDSKTKKQLINARPTEPLLVNVLNKADKEGQEFILKHLEITQEKINKFVLKLIKNNSVVFTHCHSLSVVNALIYAKKKGKKFEVYNTETRPLYQGRKTATELAKAGIKITNFIDSGARIALTKSQDTRDVDLIFFGADAILKKGVINKVGSGMFAESAFLNKIPIYILADSWKFANKIKLEERDFKEVWKKTPKGIKIKNPAFEMIPKKYVKAIISDLGILSYDKFLKNVR